jgi:RHS repeat-associated protein
VKDSEDFSSEDEDCGRVDWVRWTGAVAEPDPDNWGTLNYVYDPFGRRIEKQYDGKTVLKYLYDGDQCIAEYGAGNDLHRKYVCGPGVDQPICMTETTGSYTGTYYYHFDGSNNVVALTDDEGDTVEVYDYSVYGRVAALDASHPNRFLFTGRRYDKETGLYYYRARYYKPEIGRFLQVDPVGYDAGMNLYQYCQNNPANLRDPLGRDILPPGWEDTADLWPKDNDGKPLYPENGRPFDKSDSASDFNWNEGDCNRVGRDLFVNNVLWPVAKSGLPIIMDLASLLAGFYVCIKYVGPYNPLLAAGCSVVWGALWTFANIYLFGEKLRQWREVSTQIGNCEKYCVCREKDNPDRKSAQDCYNDVYGE